MRRVFALATGLMAICLVTGAACVAHADDNKTPKRSPAETKAIAKIKETGGQVMELCRTIRI